MRKQLKFLEQHPEVDALSGTIAEFQGDALDGKTAETAGDFLQDRTGNAERDSRLHQTEKSDQPSVRDVPEIKSGIRRRISAVSVF